ncbi:MAG: hypothetical protein RLZZ15_4158 [Verrucomicrobiota bacterium]
MPTRFPVLGALVFLLAASAALAAAPAPIGPRSGKWAHETPKALAPDPAVTWGRLDNGFRYALLPHKGVPGRATLQLIVLAGSLDERPDELGIAHYIEHLCFAGSKNFKAEDMIALFQRLGVEYGSDVNAETGFDATVFRLDFRDGDEALRREGMRLFRDFGDGVSFEPRSIEQERRVVLAELRNRRTLSDLKTRASMPVAFQGLKFPLRMPGGSEQQIARFTRENFLDFYRRNYRPDLMVFVAAGDFEPAALAAQVREIFGGMVRPSEPVPVRDEGRLAATALRAGVFRVNGVASASAEVSSVQVLPTKPDTREDHIERQQRRFVMDAFEERLKADARGAPGGGGYDELLGHGAASVSLAVPAPLWADSVVSLDELVRLTLERGLDAVDVDTLRRRDLKIAGHMVDQLATLDPAALSQALTESITGHTVFEGFAQQYAWNREWLEKFTPAEAHKVFRRLWQPETMAFHVAGGVKIELGAEDVLKEVRKSRRTGLNQVMARTRRETPFTLPKFSTPTDVVERRELPAFGAKLLRFGNQVRLNFAGNRQEPGLVRVAVRVGTGLLELPAGKPALKDFGPSSVLASGTVHLQPDDLHALVRERFLEFGFDLGDRDAFTFRGLVAVEHLETFLGVVADVLTAPQLNSFTVRDQRMEAVADRMDQSVGLGDGLRALTDYLFKGDARFTHGEPLEYVKASVVDLRRWMEPSLAGGYVEATIVGDIAEEAAVRTMTATLGSLKPRAAKKATAVPPKPVKVTAAPGVTRIEFVGEQNLGLVVGSWPISEPIHVRDQIALEVLAKILEIKVRGEVREKLGLAYSPSAEFQHYDGFGDFGLLRAQIDCAPNDTARVAPLVANIGAALAKDGVGAGEFMGARGILQSQLRLAFRDNQFLTTLLMRAQERPAEIAEIVTLRGTVINDVTREEVNAWAAKILVAKNCRAAAVVPKAFVGIMDSAR